jgi:hypothetical protein
MASMDKAAAPAGDLVDVLSCLEDPRALDGRRHHLGDILTIAFCTVLCGQEEFSAMERFGLEKEAWPRGFLALPGGIPSHDTFRAALCALDPLTPRSTRPRRARASKTPCAANSSALPSAMTSAYASCA